MACALLTLRGSSSSYRCYHVLLKFLSITYFSHDRQVQFAKGPGPSEKQQTLGKGLDPGGKKLAGELLSLKPNKKPGIRLGSRWARAAKPWR